MLRGCSIEAQWRLEHLEKVRFEMERKQRKEIGMGLQLEWRVLLWRDDACNSLSGERRTAGTREEMKGKFLQEIKQH